MLRRQLLLSRPSSLLSSQWLCPSCQSRLQRAYRHSSSTTQPSTQIPKPLSPAPKPISTSTAPNLPPKDEDFTPQPLSRPLGQPHPPKPGQNSGIDTRTWRERRDDFFNYDKHLERRKELTRKVAKPYFRDWTSLRHHKGKLFLSSPKLFKADTALYFPNMQGYTLADPGAVRDTTAVLEGKVSIVSVFSGVWAERQCRSFVGGKGDAGVEDVVERYKEQGVQKVWVNIEEDWMRAGLVRLFLGGIRRGLGRKEWGRYFIVRRGVDEGVKGCIGMVNAKVGGVYLVDERCRIRWAGSGDAVEGEREGLVAGVRRLVEGGRGGKMGVEEVKKM
ncbi:Mitochondrial ATPase complex subunit atp10 [Lecanora helva]